MSKKMTAWRAMERQINRLLIGLGCAIVTIPASWFLGRTVEDAVVTVIAWVFVTLVWMAFGPMRDLSKMD